MPELARHLFVGECTRQADPLHTLSRMQRVSLGLAGLRMHLAITNDARGRLGQMLGSAPGICSIDAAKCRHREEADAHGATRVAAYEPSPLGSDVGTDHGSLLPHCC